MIKMPKNRVNINSVEVQKAEENYYFVPAPSLKKEELSQKKTPF